MRTRMLGLCNGGRSLLSVPRSVHLGICMGAASARRAFSRGPNLPVLQCQPRAPVTVRPEVGPVSYCAHALSQRLSLLQPTSRCRKCVSVVFLVEFPAPLPCGNVFSFHERLGRCLSCLLDDHLVFICGMSNDIMKWHASIEQTGLELYVSAGRGFGGRA